eukprot:gene24105-biopygen10411
MDFLIHGQVCIRPGGVGTRAVACGPCAHAALAALAVPAGIARAVTSPQGPEVQGQAKDKMRVSVANVRQHGTPRNGDRGKEWGAVRAAVLF